MKAFTQVEIAPGGAIDATIAIPVGELTLVNAVGERVVEPGRFEVRVGRSSKRVDQLAAFLTVRPPGRSRPHRSAEVGGPSRS